MLTLSELRLPSAKVYFIKASVKDGDKAISMKESRI